jgi:hypothetical protein
MSALILRQAQLGRQAPVNVGGLPLRHLDVDPHLVNVRNAEQFPRSAVATGIDERADVGFARGHNAIEGGDHLLAEKIGDQIAGSDFFEVPSHAPRIFLGLRPWGSTGYHMQGANQHTAIAAPSQAKASKLLKVSMDSGQRARVLRQDG